MMNKNKWFSPEITNFEKKFFDDLLELQLKKSGFGLGCILNNDLNQDDFSADDFLIKCTEHIQHSEKLKAEELKNYKKLAVDSLIKINNLNAQLKKYKTFADLALDFVQCESKRNSKKENEIITLHWQIQQCGKHLDQ